MFSSFYIWKINWNFPHELFIHIFVCVCARTLYRVSLLIIRRLGSSGQDGVLMTVGRGWWCPAILLAPDRPCREMSPFNIVEITLAHVSYRRKLRGLQRRRALHIHGVYALVSCVRRLTFTVRTGFPVANCQFIRQLGLGQTHLPRSYCRHNELDILLSL